MSYSTTEETQIIGELMRSLGQGRFPILTMFLPQICFLPFRFWDANLLLLELDFLFLFLLLLFVIVIIIII